MRTIFLFFLYFLIVFGASAQSSLSGKIVNSSGVSFTYCKLILAQDSVNLTTVDADSLGRFAFSNLKDGNYTLHVKVPFKALDTLVVVSGATLFNLALDDTGILDEVEVIAKQPMIIRKVDRTIFNPADIPMLVGGDAADVIEFAPGVMIQGDQISVNGKGPAKVMLNDKLIPLQGAELISFIRAIPTEDIQYIEIIPIPPVKYASNSTLINIQLIVGSKSRYSKGEINAELGQKFYSQQAARGNFSFKKNKFSCYTNAYYSHSKYRPTGTKQILYESLRWNESIHQLSEGYSFGLGFGMNYALNKTTELGLLVTSNGYAYDDLNNGTVENRNLQDVFQNAISNRTDNKTLNSRNALSFSLNKKLDSLRRKLDFILDYTNYIRGENIRFNTDYYTQQLDSSFAENNKLNIKPIFCRADWIICIPSKK